MSQEPCPLCARPLGDVRVDRHHLIPKSQGGKEQFLIHKVCHRKIHATISEKDLARNYYTWDSLKAHPIIKTFIDWVQRKPSEFYDSSKRSRLR